MSSELDRLRAQLAEERRRSAVLSRTVDDLRAKKLGPWNAYTDLCRELLGYPRPEGEFLGHDLRARCSQVRERAEEAEALLREVKVRGYARGVGGNDQGELPPGWEDSRNALLGDPPLGWVERRESDGKS